MGETRIKFQNLKIPYIGDKAEWIGSCLLQQSSLNKSTLTGFKYYWYPLFFQPQNTHAVEIILERGFCCHQEHPEFSLSCPP
jgi:hypothetical protein